MMLYGAMLHSVRTMEIIVISGDMHHKFVIK